MIRTQRQFDFTRVCLALVSAIGIFLATAIPAIAQDTVEPPSNTSDTDITALSNPNGLDTSKIMQALFTPHSDLTLLSAHRGIHALAGLTQAEGIPENSKAAIGYAAEQGWEIIELDVKSTSDGVPVLTHDRTWGRETCYAPFFPGPPGSNPTYNPWIQPGESNFNDSANLTVNATTLSTMRSWLTTPVLRDPVSMTNERNGNLGCSGWKDITGEWAPTFADALDYIAAEKIHMVVMLDIQDLATAQAALSVVTSKFDDQGNSFLNSSIFKMPAALFPNGVSDFTNTFGVYSLNVNYIPVFQTSAITAFQSPITDTEDGGFDVSEYGDSGLGDASNPGSESSIVNWIKMMQTTPIHIPTGAGFIQMPAVELGVKEPNGILTSTMANVKTNFETGNLVTIGNFSPVGEYYSTPGAQAQFFRSSNGSCCDILDKYWFNNPNGMGPIDPDLPVDHSDQRNSVPFLSQQGFQYIITDDPSDAANYLQGQGKRNICYLQDTPGPNCSTGGLHPGVAQLNSPGIIEPVANGTSGQPLPLALLNTFGEEQNAAASQGITPKSFTQQTAYFDSWSVYENNFFIKNLDTQGIASKLTTLIYSFENIDPVNLTCFAANQPEGTDPNSPTNYDGASDAYADYQMGFTQANSVDGSTDEWGQALEGNFNQIRELKAKYPNLKVLISLGGWTYSKFFSDVAATPASRQKFVQSCINLYTNGNLPVFSTSPAGGNGAAAGIFDGFDIDWEYPASPNENVGNHYSPNDTANYTALLAEFRSELNALGQTNNKHYMLTAALPAGPSEIALMQTSQIAQYLDYGDVETYDYHGAFETNGPTNYQAPLYDSPTSPSYGTGFTVDQSISTWLSGGFPANQLLLGLAAYGRGWSGVPSGNTNGLYQSVTGATAPFPYSQEAGVADWKELVTANEISNVYYDPVALGTYVYDGTNFYGIETPWSIGFKQIYAQQRGLAGVFLYSLEDDDPASTITNAAFPSPTTQP